MGRNSRRSTTGAIPRPEGQIVRLRVAAPLADVDPSVAPLVIPLLVSDGTSCRPDGRGGITTSIERIMSYEFDRHGRLMFPVGLVPRVKAAIERHGYRVEVLHCNPPQPHVRRGDILAEGLSPESRAIVELLVRSGRGQIVTRGLGDRVALVALVARALPRAWITVAFASRGGAREFYHQLRRRIDEPIDLMLGGFFLPRRRLRVNTFGSLDPRAANLVIFGSATDALHEEAREIVDHLGNRGIFGLADPEARLGARERLRLEMVLGPVIYEMPDPRGRPADVKVRLVEAPWSPAPGREDVLGRKRAIWADGRRNVAIAELAAALADDRPERLERYGLSLEEDDGPARDERPRRRVAVLVESPEHGRHLGRLLPDWSLRTGVGGAIEATGAGCAPDGQEDEPDLDRAVVTLVYAHHQDRLDVDVLVRADGNSWPLEVPGFPPRRFGTPGPPVTLVDLGDDFDEEAEVATRARLCDYSDRGWEVVAATRWSAIGPVADQKQGRPGRGRKRRGRR